jgi:hypothetical protein
MNTEQLVKPQTPAPFNFLDAEQFATMQRVCKLFANSELVPDMYKISEKNPVEKAIANCMIAIEMAQRTGSSPLMVMQNLIIVYGKPSWSSKFLVATINTCGRFNPLQYRFTEKGMLGEVDYIEYEKKWTPGVDGRKGHYETNAKHVTFDGSNTMDIECVAFTTAKGSDKVLESSPVSVRLAILERWYTKDGSKWPTMKKQMLMYRAASFWTNTYAPELSMGMKTDDEIRDIVDVEYEDVSYRVATEIDEKANTGTPLSFAAEQKTDPIPEPELAPSQTAPAATPASASEPQPSVKQTKAPF